MTKTDKFMRQHFPLQVFFLYGTLVKFAQQPKKQQLVRLEVL